MLKILQFIFSSFWTFLGTVILFGIAVEGIIGLAFTIRIIFIGDKQDGESSN